MILKRILRIAHDNKSVRINGEINAPEIRLVGIEGDQLGIVSIAEAMRLAEEAEVDLVEIAPTAVPPVCRIMDCLLYTSPSPRDA